MHPAPSERSALTEVGAVVLAGGRARRFDGRDKGLIALDGRPLAAWVAERLAGQVGGLVLSANRNLAEYAALGHPVVEDVLPGQIGPLAGIYSAAQTLHNEWLLTAPCDTPFLPADLALSLLKEARRTGASAVFAEDERQRHYSVMLFQRGLAAELRQFLDSGERQVRAWLLRVNARPVTFPEPDAFFNVNTPEDLAGAEILVRHPV